MAARLVGVLFLRSHLPDLDCSALSSVLYLEHLYDFTMHATHLHVIYPIQYLLFIKSTVIIHLQHTMRFVTAHMHISASLFSGR